MSYTRVTAMDCRELLRRSLATPHTIHALRSHSVAHPPSKQKAASVASAASASVSSKSSRGSPWRLAPPSRRQGISSTSPSWQLRDSSSAASNAGADTDARSQPGGPSGSESPEKDPHEALLSFAVLTPLAAESPERAAALRASLHGLLRLDRPTHWNVTADRKGLWRAVRFRTFRQARRFLVELLARVAEHRHHPTITTTYAEVLLTWTTHRDPDNQDRAGISPRDADMARISDRLARECGELDPDEGEAKT